MWEGIFQAQGAALLQSVEKLKEPRRTRPDTYCTSAFALPYTSTSNLLHFLSPTWTQWSRHPMVYTLRPGFQSIPLVISSWGLCSVTFKQHHIPQGCWGQFTLIASLWWNALHLQSPKLLSACTKCRQISHPPHLPLQRRERPKPVVPTVNVMSMNDFRTLRILLKALSLAGNPYQHRTLLAENTQ